MLELFMIKTTDIAEFLKQNQRYLEKSRISISNEVFEKLWDTCLENNGKIDIKQPMTKDSRRSIGYYNFTYTRKNSDGALEELKVVVRLQNASKKLEKRLFIEAVSAGQYRYTPSKSLITDKIYIDFHHALKQEKTIDKGMEL